MTLAGQMCAVLCWRGQCSLQWQALGSFLGYGPMMDCGVIFSEVQGCLPSLREESSLFRKRETSLYVEVAQMLPHLGCGDGKTWVGT